MLVDKNSGKKFIFLKISTDQDNWNQKLNLY